MRSCIVDAYHPHTLSLPQPDGDAVWRCRSQLAAQKYVMNGSVPHVDAGLLGLCCVWGEGLEVEEAVAEQEGGGSSSSSADDDEEEGGASLGDDGVGEWRRVPPLSSAFDHRGGRGSSDADAAPAPPFRLLVTVGHTLERATAGVFRATARRVVLQGRDMVSPLEIAFSLRARAGAVLNAVALCRRAPRFVAPGLMYPMMAAVESVGEYERRMGVWEGEGKEREERGGHEAEAMEVDEGPPPPPLPDAPMATAEGAKEAAAEQQQQQHWVDGGEIAHPGPWKPSAFKYSDLPTLAQLAHDADGADGAALKNVQVDSYPCTQVGWRLAPLAPRASFVERGRLRPETIEKQTI